MKDLITVAFELILHSGNARSAALEAINHAQEYNFEAADECIKTVKEEITQAHSIQTDLIQEESQGNQTEISLLLIHAQDHLMNAITVKEMSEKFIFLYKKLQEKGI